MNIRNVKGQALVEIALSLPLLLLILFGIAEFGRAFYMTNTLNYAAREGARRASVSPKPLNMGDLSTKVADCIPFDKTDLDIQITPADPVPGVSTMNVRVTLPFRFIVPLVPERANIAPLITLRGEASMRYE